MGKTGGTTGSNQYQVRGTAKRSDSITPTPPQHLLHQADTSAPRPTMASHFGNLGARSPEQVADLMGETVVLSRYCKSAREAHLQSLVGMVGIGGKVPMPDGTTFTVTEGSPSQSFDQEAIWSHISQDAADSPDPEQRVLATARGMLNKQPWSTTGIRDVLNQDPDRFCTATYGDLVAVPSETGYVSAEGLGLYETEIVPLTQSQPNAVSTAQAVIKLDAKQAELRAYQVAMSEHLVAHGNIGRGEQLVGANGTVVELHRQVNRTGWNHDAVWDSLKRLPNVEADSSAERAQGQVERIRQLVGKARWSVRALDREKLDEAHHQVDGKVGYRLS